jgi:hypothetical protein
MTKERTNLPLARNADYGVQGAKLPFIPKEFNIDSYDRSFQGFWRGAIGDLVLVPRANCNSRVLPNASPRTGSVQSPWKSGLRWLKFAHRTLLRLLNDDPYRPASRALSADEFEPSYGLILTSFGITLGVATTLGRKLILNHYAALARIGMG